MLYPHNCPQLPRQVKVHFCPLPIVPVRRYSRDRNVSWQWPMAMYPVFASLKARTRKVPAPLPISLFSALLLPPLPPPGGPSRTSLALLLRHFRWVPRSIRGDYSTEILRGGVVGSLCRRMSWRKRVPSLGRGIGLAAWRWRRAPASVLAGLVSNHAVL